jgi:hypothetical protein
LTVSGNTTLNNITTCISSLNVSGNTTLNNATTINSSLNVVGNIIGSGTALTSLNYNAILNPPTLVSFNNPSTFISTLNISGNTTLNNATTINSSLNVVGDVNTSGLSVFGINTNLNSLSTNSTLSINNLNTTSTTIFNTLSGKQNNLTFSNPFLNTSNTISLKYDNTKLNVDGSGNLTVIGGTSQWTTTGTSIFYNGNVDCGGGIAINGSNAFFTPGGTVVDLAVDAGNLTNTYINFKNAGAAGDWCYLRQIGTSEAYKLAFDFHDDNNDARFCLRSVQSAVSGGVDVIKEVFTVDMGNVTCANSLIVGNNNSYPDIKLGSTNGNNISIATTPNSFSNSALANDMVIRSINNMHLLSGAGNSAITIKATNNNVGIGTNNPSNILQVGDGARLRISNSVSDYSVIGTKDVDDATNTRIVISGNTRGAPYAGNIEYISTSGSHIFYTSGTNERMRITNAGNISCTGSIGCVGISTSGGALIGTSLGIKNSAPQSMLHLGNCEVANSAPVIIFGKNVSGAGPSSGLRNAFMGYTDTFFFVIGDYGSSNAGPNTLTQQLAIQYSAPALSLLINSYGYVTMQYGYGAVSDERIKTNIRTIENALDKTLLLRGVEYNDIRIEPEKKKIGLIAQETELIIPEVVRTDDNGMKSIEYQNLVGLLVQAIKELNNKVINLENILKKNNLN